MAAEGPGAWAGAGGSRTLTVTLAAPEPVVLRLPAAPPARRIMWDESVVDNEGQGRRSSKGAWRGARAAAAPN